jgi:hypothetical protein
MRYVVHVGDITDKQDEAWCTTNFLSSAALRLAVVIRAELLEVMQRIELPVSPPAFGCQDNCTNVKRALISGFFLKVRLCLSILAI